MSTEVEVRSRCPACSEERVSRRGRKAMTVTEVWTGGNMDERSTEDVEEFIGPVSCECLSCGHGWTECYPGEGNAEPGNSSSGGHSFSINAYEANDAILIHLRLEELITLYAHSVSCPYTTYAGVLFRQNYILVAPDLMGDFQLILEQLEIYPDRDRNPDYYKWLEDGDNVQE